ncbi:MAG TPA: hypothetical protein VFH58_03505 [Acidimicrobiales bacterium]|nr:hypothetical protein [Acidimicrobiales bacterium]
MTADALDGSAAPDRPAGGTQSQARPTEPTRPPRVAVRAPTGPPAGPPRSVPGPDDLYQRDHYGETLLRSLMRAQLGVTVGVLLPAAAVVATYPLLSVLLPHLSQLMVGPVPLSILVLGFGIYPPFVALAVLYVRRARRVEERFVHLLHEE